VFPAQPSPLVAPELRGGSAVASSSSAQGPAAAAPVLTVTSALSELSFGPAAVPPTLITQTLGQAAEAGPAATPGRAPGRERADGGSAGTNPDLGLPQVNAPAKAVQAVSSVFAGDDSVSLFESVAEGSAPPPRVEGRPVSRPKADDPAPAPPAPAPAKDGPGARAPTPGGWAARLAAWLALPLFASATAGRRLFGRRGGSVS
jgi:hypothetical protein